MFRLGIFARLALIVVGSILVLQSLAFLARLSSGDGLDFDGLNRPLLRQVEDLVTLFDDLPPADRAVAETVTLTGRLHAHVIEAVPPVVRSGPVLDFMAGVIARRLEALTPPGRLVSVDFVMAGEQPKNRDAVQQELRNLRMILSWAQRNLRIVYELSDGSHLVVEPQGEVAILGNLLLWLTLLVSLAVGLVAILAVGREARPLEELARNVETFAKTATPVAMAETGARELRTLIRATNAMQRQIATLLANRTMILAGLSHDLRTEVTRLRLRLELLEPSPTRDKAVADVETMQALVEDCLEFARLGLEPSDGEADAGAVVAEALEPHRQAGAPVRLDRPRYEVRVPMSSAALRRLIDNLVVNALSYAGSAEVRVRREGAEAVIEVADNGPGIPESEREKIFEPFYRLETSRGRATGGSGLGLAIVKQIVERQGGRIEVLGAIPQGTVFRVTFALS